MPDLRFDPLSISWWRNLFAKTSRWFGWGCAAVFGIPLVIGFGWTQYSNRGQDQAGAGATSSTLVTVNGEAIPQGVYLFQVQQSVDPSQPAPRLATTQGQVLNQLVMSTLGEQEAKKRGLKPNEAEVDKSIDQLRTSQKGSGGKPLTDDEWQSYVDQRFHMSSTDFREFVAKQSLFKALFDSTKAAEPITATDAKNQYAEAKLSPVFVASANPSPIMQTPAGVPKPLPDAEARKKADDMLAKVRSGADIVAMAKANSTSPDVKKTGETGWMPEYQVSPQMGASHGSLGYGKDFDDAVHRTQVGQVSEAVKVNGFEPGYMFARVVQRRSNLPKDFDAAKVIESLKQQKASDDIQKLLTAEMKVAKVVFPDQQIDKRAFYDYYKLSEMQRAQMMAQFGSPTGDEPTAADIDRQQKQLDSDYERLLSKEPDSPAASTIAQLYADSLRSQMFKLPAADQPKMRDRVILLLETALKTSEGQGFATRFALADMYRDKKDFKLAAKNYRMISHLQDNDIPTDLTSMQETLRERQQLATAFKGFSPTDVPEAPALLDTQVTAIAKLNGDIAIEQQKQAAEAKKQKEAEKAMRPAQGSPAPAPIGPGGNAAGVASGVKPAAPAPALATPATAGAAGTSGSPSSATPPRAASGSSVPNTIPHAAAGR